jgi:hypothetical protein
MVHDAMDPVAPELAIMAAAHQGRVLARHGGLVAVAVERPGLHLALIQLSAMQQLMEGMLVVVALGADGAKLLLKLLGTHDLGHGIASRVAQCLARKSASRLLEATASLYLDGLAITLNCQPLSSDIAWNLLRLRNVGRPNEQCMMRS